HEKDALRAGRVRDQPVTGTGTIWNGGYLLAADRSRCCNQGIYRGQFAILKCWIAEIHDGVTQTGKPCYERSVDEIVAVRIAGIGNRNRAIRSAVVSAQQRARSHLRVGPVKHLHAIRVEEQVSGGIALSNTSLCEANPIVQNRDRRARAEIKSGVPAEIPIRLAAADRSTGCDEDLLADGNRVASARHGQRNIVRSSRRVRVRYR